MNWKYDAFISYSRADRGGASDLIRVVNQLRRSFQTATKRELLLFIDSENIENAELWEKRINLALRSSAIFIPIISTNYLKSKWCTRELDIFLALEHLRQEKSEQRLATSLIFPILLNNVTFSEQESADNTARARELRKRQWTNLAGLRTDDAEWTSCIERLGSDLAHTVEKLAAKPSTGSEDFGIKDASPATPLVAAHAGINEIRFIQLLAKARSAIVVGVTNAWLPGCLEEAILLKKKERGTVCLLGTFGYCFPSRRPSSLR